MNTTLDESLNPNVNLPTQQIQCRYFSSHSFEQHSHNLMKDSTRSSLSIFHNNIVSVDRNFSKLITHYLADIEFKFDIIGVSETKITKSNDNVQTPKLPGYNFES